MTRVVIKTHQTTMRRATQLLPSYLLPIDHTPPYTSSSLTTQIFFTSPRGNLAQCAPSSSSSSLILLTGCRSKGGVRLPHPSIHPPTGTMSPFWWIRLVMYGMEEVLGRTPFGVAVRCSIPSSGSLNGMRGLRCAELIEKHQQQRRRKRAHPDGLH